MSKTTTGSSMPEAQPAQTPYPTETTVELPLALVDLISVFAAGHHLPNDAHPLGDTKQRANVGWALFKELGEYHPDDQSLLSEVDLDDFLVKHAGEVGYSLDDIDFDTDPTNE